MQMNGNPEPATAQEAGRLPASTPDAHPLMSDPARWAGIVRDFTNADVENLRGSLPIRHTLAEVGAERLWKLLGEKDSIHALGALTGNPDNPDNASPPVRSPSP